MRVGDCQEVVEEAEVGEFEGVGTGKSAGLGEETKWFLDDGLLGLLCDGRGIGAGEISIDAVLAVGVFHRALDPASLANLTPITRLGMCTSAEARCKFPFLRGDIRMNRHLV